MSTGQARLGATILGATILGADEVSALVSELATGLTRVK